MFIIKENLLFGEQYLEHTASDNALKSLEILTEEVIINQASLAMLLEERYGVVKRKDCTLPVYEIASFQAGVWHCKRCQTTAFQRKTHFNDLLQFIIQNQDGDIVGTVYWHNFNDAIQAMELFDNGFCPICEAWDDGLGRICSPRGWGKTAFFFKNCKLIGK